MSKPKAIILRTAGTNCDWETEHAFELAGAKARSVHINRLINNEAKLSSYDILAIPGGFSYGDDIASGKILANEIKYKLEAQIKKFAVNNKPIIGICNGFQVLVKMGFLPDEELFEQKTTLTFNDSDRFECRWVNLKMVQNPKSEFQCLWTQNLPEIIQLPVAHAEGKFVVDDTKILRELEHNNQIVFQYVNDKGKPAEYPFNPNGAMHSVAAICNRRGNIMGMMPHPERNIYKFQNPSRQGMTEKSEHAWGLQIFKNAVEHVNKQ